MSIKNYASVQKRFDVLLTHYNLKGYGALALFLGVNYQTLMAWKKRDSIGDYSAFLDKCIGISLDWLKTGEGEMFRAERAAEGAYQHPDAKIQKIVELLEGMDDNTKEGLLRCAEKEKLLMELMKEKLEKKAG